MNRMIRLLCTKLRVLAVTVSKACDSNRTQIHCALHINCWIK